MAQFSQLRTVLETTHSQIPQLLARERAVSRELGSNETAELQRQLQGVTTERESAARRRMAAIGAIVALEGPLQAERVSVETARQSAATEAAREFGERWQQACHVLAVLRAEAVALGAALRVTIPAPPPYTLFTHPADGASRLRPVETPEAPPVLPAHLSTLGKQLDQLDGA